MKVLGTVKDAATEVPLSEAQYIGEILICKVEKAGYGPQKVIQEFEEDEVTLAIKLVPRKDEKIELTVNLKDEKRNPLKGVNISLELDGEEVGVGISDKDGIFKISLSPDLEDKTINYKAELAGFELASGAVQLKKETSVKITMKKLSVPPSNRKWLKIVAVVAGIAIVILAVMIILPTHEPKPKRPVINSFEASPSKISAGESSTLRWSVSDATSRTIDHEIEKVASAGTEVVSPTETTTYTLTATNNAGTRDATVEVIVKEGEVNLPVISSFEASPSAISTGEGSRLSWSVSDATSVTIDPEIGTVALTGTRQASPTETTIYTLTATNDAGNRFDTVRVIVNDFDIREVIVKEEEVNLPVISSFEASPSAISTGDGSTLTWSVSDATRVTIEPAIGDVALTGSRGISPVETTTYTITATNDAGRR
jgi:hypothetical protein